ncbi:MAG: FIG01126594: hypothetical protein [uncultured Thiotrichaceae bacterium]|uniref:Metallopeptidase domain-containing protein n=1 Tax=uncultured Thiotrichaceae bacterium TaxID=298394 RepID=A0A6S6TBX5_9GAMM|nr:MAG: FIG01126594: hypothetical protein [uncultured Thiotrichaceae bacterium]
MSSTLEQVIYDANHQLQEHPLFGVLSELVYVHCNSKLPPETWAQLHESRFQAALHVNHKKKLSVDEWVYILALGHLHVAMEHLLVNPKTESHKLHACYHAAHHFVQQMNIGKRPANMLDSDGIGGKLASWINDSRPHYMPYEKQERWQAVFDRALNAAAQAALAQIAYHSDKRSPVSINLRDANLWIINSFPLLSALASSFILIENADICKQMHIDIAAIHPVLKEVYIHPRWHFSKPQMIFILLHEYLHIGLRHDIREQGRDPYYWNVACDYVINGWLMEMAIGEMPVVGMLYDPKQAGRSAEEIYDDILQNVNWQRRLKREKTPRGDGRPDIISDKPPAWWISGDGVSLDEFYRYSIVEGLEYAEKRGRGDFPAGLVEEIRAISQPPIPWDVQLTEWLDQYFPPLEKRRSYARASRRQSSTPDIPRPSWSYNLDSGKERTFGVLLDTSGSMSRSELAKALGAIAAYAQSREVRFIRLVYCDAIPYDAGYVEVEALLHQVEVKGRGGTVLQPAINLLEKAKDFPARGPLLIISDGYFEAIRVRMEHAYLLSQGCRLAFKTPAPVFYFD